MDLPKFVQSRGMSSWHAFGAVLSSVSRPLDRASQVTEQMQSHLSTSPCALLDTSGHINFLAGVPASTWDLLRSCAAGSLHTLGGPVATLGSTVASVFASELAAFATLDTLLTVQLAEAKTMPIKGLSGDLPALLSIVRRAERLLERALSDRAIAVYVWAPKEEGASVGSGNLPGLGDRPFLCVGLRLNKDEVSRSDAAAGIVIISYIRHAGQVTGWASGGSDIINLSEELA
jgi:hypothetical protein